MSIERANAYFSDADRASYSQALQGVKPFRNSAVIDLGQDFSKWFDGDGPAKERYCVRPANWIPIYKFTPVFGDTVDENLRWLSPVGEVDDFTDPISDTMYDGMTSMPGGPWACMNQANFLQMGKGLGEGLGQMYRLRPDGVWIKVGG
jgi:hypothetical protein